MSLHEIELFFFLLYGMTSFFLLGLNLREKSSPLALLNGKESDGKRKEEEKKIVYLYALSQ